MTGREITPSGPPEIDIFVPSTGNFNLSTLDHMQEVEQPVRSLGTHGHFDNEVDLAGSEDLKGMKVDKQASTYFFVFPVGQWCLCRVQASRTMSTSCQRAQ